MTPVDGAIEFNHEVEADKNYAQLLIQVSLTSKEFAQVKKIIKNLDVHIVEAKSLLSNLTLIKLDIKDMRNLSLKLTELGFTIKGINALTLKG